MSEPVRINRPGEGARKPKLSNKWYWIGGAAGLGLIYWYYKKQQASATAAQASTDTTGTGTGYGDFSNTGTDYSGLGTSSPYNYQPVNTFTPAPSNALWFQNALAFLVSNGYDPATAGTALGKYLAGAGLTQDELNIVQAAIGAEGLPPSPPPPAHLEPPTSVVGPISAPRLSVSTKKIGTRTIVTLSWTAVQGAVKYVVLRMGTFPVATVGGTSYQYTRLAAGVPYAVRAVDAQGKSSQPSNIVVVP